MKNNNKSKTVKQNKKISNLTKIANENIGKKKNKNTTAKNKLNSNSKKVKIQNIDEKKNKNTTTKNKTISNSIKIKNENIDKNKSKNIKNDSVNLNNGKENISKNINKINYKINIIFLLLIIFIGISFARYVYRKTSTNNNNILVTGDIYMRYISNETKNVSMIPKDTYDEDEYFEFSVYGKNQSSNDIYYNIVLKYGETKASPYTRIFDEFVKFRLVKVVNDNEEEVVFEKKSFSNFDNKSIYVGIIPGNSNDLVNETYRLYVWVSDVIVGNVPEATYTSEEWEKVYANVDVQVTGDFAPKGTDSSIKVNFDANGGNIKVPYKYYDVGSKYGELPIPVRDGYKFVGWLYNDNIVKSTDYVFEYGKTFVREDDFEFDGTNYIDTGVYLFNNANANKNFYLSFTIKENPGNIFQATLINAKLEDQARGYPGFLFRKASGDYYEISTNNVRVSTLPYNTSKVDIVRINNKLYYKLDDGEFILAFDYTGFDNYFDVPLTIGASLTSNKVPQRYFIGTLSNLILQFLDDNATLDNYLDHLVPPSLEGITLQAIWSKEKYEYKGEYEFVGSNYIDTEIYLFSQENWQKNFYMSFEIVEDRSTDTMATPMSAKYETKTPYQGFELRHNGNNTDYRSKALKDSSSYKQVTSTINTTKKVRYLRINKVLYYSFNDNNFTKLLDFDGFELFFDFPVTFGASLLNKNSPQRYFTGILKDITVEFISDSATVQDYET